MDLLDVLTLLLGLSALASLEEVGLSACRLTSGLGTGLALLATDGNGEGSVGMALLLDVAGGAVGHVKMTGRSSGHGVGIVVAGGRTVGAAGISGHHPGPART